MRWVYAIAFLLLFSLGCGKSTDPIPNVPVDFSVSLQSPAYSKLRSPGSSVTIPGVGIAGVIIYHDAFDNGYDAYDRCSSYKPENKCAVTIDTSGFTATDPCSGSKFLLSDGSPAKGPASQSLKAYFVTVSGGGYVLTVSN